MTAHTIGMINEGIHCVGFINPSYHDIPNWLNKEPNAATKTTAAVVMKYLSFI